jgi:Ca2+-binding RTX toxin-like protein
LNTPVLLDLVANGTKSVLEGYVNGLSNSSFRIEFFATDAGLPGVRQGQTYLGSTMVDTDSSGQASFSVQLEVPANQIVTATAIDPINNTSEFSNTSPNFAPHADAGGPYGARENQTITLDGSRSRDPDQPANTLLYHWDLDDDGVFGEVGSEAERGDETGIRPSFSTHGLAMLSVVPVALKVTDDIGRSDLSITSLSIKDTLHVVGTPASDMITVQPGSGDTILVSVNGSVSQASLSLYHEFHIDAGNGNDNVTILDSISMQGTILGGAGDDILTGGSGDETIMGGDGNDRVNGGPGDDHVEGEAGNDIVIASRGRDRLLLGTGKNSIVLGSLASSLTSLSANATDAGIGSRKMKRNDLYLADQVSVAMNGQLSGSYGQTSTGTGQKDGCTANVSINGAGTVDRLKLKFGVTGTIKVSCGSGSVTANVTGSGSGAISLKNGTITFSAVVESSFSGKRSRSRLRGVDIIRELDTDIA